MTFLEIYPLFNFVVDILSEFFEKQGMLSIFRAFILTAFILFMTLGKIKISRYNIFIYLFLGYLIILIPFSSNIEYSSRVFLQVSFTLLMFPVSFFYIKNVQVLGKLNLSIIWILIFFIVNTILATYFSFGPSVYEDSRDFLTGNIKSGSLNTITYSLLLIPIIMPLIKHKKNKFIIYIISTISFLLLILAFKRISILGVIIGYFTYLTFINFKYKYITRSLGFIMIILIAYPLYKDILFIRFQSRIGRVQIDSYESEARYMETFFVFEEVFSFKSPVNSWFGKEIFNSPYNYAGGYFGSRQLHIDYNNLLHGSGIVGLSLYFLIFLMIFRKFLSLKNKIPNTLYFGKLKAMFISIFIVSFILSISGQMYAITFRSICFIYMGAILGIFNYNASKKFRVQSAKTSRFKKKIV